MEKAKKTVFLTKKFIIIKVSRNFEQDLIIFSVFSVEKAITAIFSIFLLLHF